MIVAATRAPSHDLDIQAIRREFPALAQTVHGWPLVYLDNAATAQKPRIVLDALRSYYEADCANVHRGAYLLSERAGERYEGARQKVARFLNASDASEIIFVRGATEAINLVAAGFAGALLAPGDTIVVSEMEHHSNIVPWQLATARVGATVTVLPFADTGELLLDELPRLLTPRTRLVAVTHVSNALGTVNPIREIVRQAHARGVPVLVDGSQAVPHLAVDVQALDCDFYVFSGHKLYGPTGVGVLYGKRERLEALPPYQGGGDMIRSVSFAETTYAPLPHRFEAGTPNIAGVIGLGAAVDFVAALDLAAIAAHEQTLLAAAHAALAEVEGVRVVGTARRKTGVVAFTMDGIHPHDIATILDRRGIAVRAGHHCAQPVMRHYGLAATARASFALYNTTAEIQAFAHALASVREVFRR